ncbi:MAG: hypothetical protein ACPGQL_09045 [Thermoplasmatota archaeon]
MSPPGFLVAAALIVVLAVIHSVLGERAILMRLRKGALPPLFGDDTFTRNTLRFVWHALTLAWWAIAALLVLAPAEAEALVGWTTIAVLFATALLTIVISRGRHLSWVVELVAAGAVATALL